MTLDPETKQLLEDVLGALRDLDGAKLAETYQELDTVVRGDGKSIPGLAARLARLESAVRTVVICLAALGAVFILTHAAALPELIAWLKLVF